MSTTPTSPFALPQPTTSVSTNYTTQTVSGFNPFAMPTADGGTAHNVPFVYTMSGAHNTPAQSATLPPPTRMMPTVTGTAMTVPSCWIAGGNAPSTVRLPASPTSSGLTVPAQYNGTRTDSTAITQMLDRIQALSAENQSLRDRIAQLESAHKP